MYSLKQTPGYFRLSASILSPFFLWRNIKEVFSFVWQFVYIFLLDFEGERAVVSFEERKKKKKRRKIEKFNFGGKHFIQTRHFSILTSHFLFSSEKNRITSENLSFQPFSIYIVETWYFYRTSCHLSLVCNCGIALTLWFWLQEAAWNLRPLLKLLGRMQAVAQLMTKPKMWVSTTYV